MSKRVLKPSERNVVCFYCTESMQYKALKKLTIRRYSGQPARVQITSQISQKESQWRQGRHGKIYKTLFKEGPHQSKIFHYVIDVIHYLLINKLNPARKKILQCFYRFRRRETFFNVGTAIGGAKACFFYDSPAIGGGKLFSSMILPPPAAAVFFGMTVPPSAAPKSENGAGSIFIKNAVFCTLYIKKLSAQISCGF